MSDGLGWLDKRLRTHIQTLRNDVVQLVLGRMAKSANLSDIADDGASRANLRVPMLSSCQAVATANITLSGTQTIDGYAAVVGDRVLAAGQTTASQNGPWIVASGAWTRPTDYSAGLTMRGRSVQINAGTLFGGTLWVLATSSTITVDTTATTWQLGTRRGRRDLQLAAAGYLSESFPFELVSAQTVLATGAVFGALQGLAAGDVVTGIAMVTATAGAGTAPTLFKVGLVDPAGNIVAVSANANSDAKLTTANSVFGLAFTSPYTVPKDGGYRSIVLEVGAFGTTAVQFGRATPLQNAAMSSPFGSNLRRLSTYGSSVTDIAVAGTLGAAANNASAIWMACY